MISPELPERTADMAAKQKLTFPILWDERSQVAEAFGLAFVRRPDEWGTAGPPDPTPDAAHDIVVDDFGQLADQLGC